MNSIVHDVPIEKTFDLKKVINDDDVRDLLASMCTAIIPTINKLNKTLNDVYHLEFDYKSWSRIYLIATPYSKQELRELRLKHEMLQPSNDPLKEMREQAMRTPSMFDDNPVAYVQPPVQTNHVARPTLNKKQIEQLASRLIEDKVVDVGEIIRSVTNRKSS
jgi:hypothetical protein